MELQALRYAAMVAPMTFEQAVDEYRRFLEKAGRKDEEFAGTDYAFRIFIAKSVWSQVLSEFAEETDYDNFKSEVACHQGRAGVGYERTLHDVWSVMYKLQK
jgi:hypothetical protein